MSNDYTQMWKELGLDLTAHDALLQVLGKGYKDIFLSQSDRPTGHGLLQFRYKRNSWPEDQGTY